MAPRKRSSRRQAILLPSVAAFALFLPAIGEVLPKDAATGAFALAITLAGAGACAAVALALLRPTPRPRKRPIPMLCVGDTVRPADRLPVTRENARGTVTQIVLDSETGSYRCKVEWGMRATWVPEDDLVKVLVYRAA